MSGLWHHDQTKSGNYSEGAHIRPLGRPHDGDDATDNILSLCPNHHVMLDKGAISISNDFELLGEEVGSLTLHEKHKINLSNLEYHRKITAMIKVTCGLIFSEDKVFLCRRNPKKSLGGYWEFPGRQSGATGVLDACLRESCRRNWIWMST